MAKDILKKGFNNVVFDCDSTLSAIEGIDFLAKRRGKEKEVEVLTKQAMDGRIKFESVFSRRLDLIKPRKQDLDWLAGEYIRHCLGGAPEIIETLQGLGKNVFVITGGYEQAVKKFTDFLGVPRENVFAVEMEFTEKGDYLSFNKKNLLTRNGGKTEVLKKISATGRTVFVGDAATDLEAKPIVDLFVGFGGVVQREIVRKKSDIYINFKSLMPIVGLAAGIN